MISEWRKIRELGRGGQGTVWHVEKDVAVSSAVNERLIQKFNQAQTELTRLSQMPPQKKTVGERRSVTSTKKKPSQAVLDLVRVVREIQDEIANLNPATGALKELHQPDEARDIDNARSRFENEVKALTKIDHPNVLKLVDIDER